MMENLRLSIYAVSHKKCVRSDRERFNFSNCKNNITNKQKS